MDEVAKETAVGDGCFLGDWASAGQPQPWFPLCVSDVTSCCRRWGCVVG